MSHIAAGVQYIHSRYYVQSPLSLQWYVIYQSHAKQVHFRSRDGTWIVSNFEVACYGPDGLESFEGTGVTGYRAPELLSADIFQPVPYTDKVDIWALGCILFALVMTRDAFRDDIATLCAKQDGDIPSVDVLGIDLEFQQKLSVASNMMLALDPDKRASAGDLCDLFNRYRN
jgi:serine/threonine protein kinase